MMHLLCIACVPHLARFMVNPPPITVQTPYPPRRDSTRSAEARAWERGRPWHDPTYADDCSRHRWVSAHADRYYRNSPYYSHAARYCRIRYCPYHRSPYYYDYGSRW